MTNQTKHLIEDSIGAATKTEYGKAGSKVELLFCVHEMALVKNDKHQFWVRKNNLKD